MKKKTTPHKNLESHAPQIPFSPLLTWLTWGILAWITFVLFNYLSENPVMPILDHADTWFPNAFPRMSLIFNDVIFLSVGLAMWFGAFSLGFVVTKKAALPSALGRFVVASGVGFGLLSMLIFFLGVAQVYSKSSLVFLLSPFVFLGVFHWKKGIRDMFSSARSELMEIWSATSGFMWFLLGIILCMGLLMTFVPECFYDALVYHLGAPRWYLLEGGIKKIANITFNFPLGIQMLYLMALGLGGEASAKSIHWICGVLLCLGMLAWGREKKSPKAGLLAAASFISIPMGQMNLWTTGMDIGMSFFALCCAWTWSSYNYDDANDPHNFSCILLAAAFSGFCFAAKLTGGVIIGVLFCTHIGMLLYKKRSLKIMVTDALIISVVSGLIILPWLIRSYIFTGNPVNPFFSHFFGGLDADRQARFYGESQGVTPHSLVEFLRFPWDVTFKGLSGISYMGPIGLALLPVIFIVLFNKKQRESSLAHVLLFSLLGIIVVACINRLTRYWLPFLSVFYFCLGYFLLEALKPSKVKAIAATALIFCMVAVNCVHAFAIGFGNYRPWPVLLGQESKDDFTSYIHPGLNPYPSDVLFRWAKANLPAASKILLIGEEKVAHLEVPFLVAGVYDRPILSGWAHGCKNSQELREKFAANKITDILINIYEGKRLLGYGTADYSHTEIALICEFWDAYVRLEKTMEIPDPKVNPKAPIFLYRVVDKPDQNPSPRNLIFWLYEESVAPQEAPNAWAKKRELLESLVKEFPNVAEFQRRYHELQSVPAESK